MKNKQLAVIMFNLRFYVLNEDTKARIPACVSGEKKLKQFTEVDRFQLYDNNEQRWTFYSDNMGSFGILTSESPKIIKSRFPYVRAIIDPIPLTLFHETWKKVSNLTWYGDYDVCFDTFEEFLNSMYWFHEASQKKS